MATTLLDDFPGKLLYCVCKIIMTDINGKDHHSTGFWYSTVIDNKQVFGLISAKHCFDNYSKAVLKLCRMDYLTGLPIDQLACDILLSTEDLDNNLIKDDKEDLCFIILQIDNVPTTNLIKPPFLIPITDEILLDIDTADDFMLAQDVIMIGYPQGIYDDINNKPVLRKGITSSPIKLDFKGQPQFLLDISCHHGSSGSPVFIADKGVYLEKNSILPGPRLLFVGIFVGGWEEVTDSGTIVEANIDGVQSKIEIKIPNNLGFVLKPICINNLKSIIRLYLKSL